MNKAGLFLFCFIRINFFPLFCFYFVLNLGIRCFIRFGRCCVCFFLLFFLILRDNLNADIQVERLFRFVIVFLIDAADFQIEVRLLFKTTAEMKAPYAALLVDVEVATFISFHDVILDVIL